MVDRPSCFHHQFIGIFYIFFQFLQCFALAEYPWNLFELPDIPSIVLPILEKKCAFHFSGFR